MPFKRFLAILLLLILPLQSTLAAVDLCCIGGASEAVRNGAGSHAKAQAESSAAQDGADGICCAQCHFCHHAPGNLAVQAVNGLSLPLSGAPVPHLELAFDSFISDIPSRPDRA
jgi:cytochrome c553